MEFGSFCFFFSLVTRSTPNAQTSTSPNLRNVKQSSEAESSLPQTVLECSLCLAGLVPKISRNLSTHFSAMLLTDRQTHKPTDMKTLSFGGGNSDGFNCLERPQTWCPISTGLPRRQWIKSLQWLIIIDGKIIVIYVIYQQFNYNKHVWFEHSLCLPDYSVVLMLAVRPGAHRRTYSEANCVGARWLYIETYFNYVTFRSRQQNQYFADDIKQFATKKLSYGFSYRRCVHWPGAEYVPSHDLNKRQPSASTHIYVSRL